MGMSQESHGFLHLSLFQQLPNIGGADRYPIQSYLGQHITADAQLPALLLKPLGIACALVSEMEVIAADQMPRLELTIQIFLNEHIPGHMHHGLVKMRQNHV